MSKDRRIFGLDLIRSIAIMSVLMGHGFKYISDIIPPHFYIYFLPDGVAIFFVLSGFLIGNIIIREFFFNKFTFNSLLVFYIRRWLRTLPAYYVVLTLLIYLYLDCGYGAIDNSWKYFIFSQNIFSPHPVFFSEAWSLSTEEWFYLIFPLLLFAIYAFNLLSNRSILIVLFFLFTLVLLFRYFIVTVELLNVNIWDQYYRKIILSRFDSIGFGVLGAYIYIYHNQIWKKYKLIAFNTGLFVIIVSMILININHEIFIFHFYLWLISAAILLTFPLLSTFEIKKSYFKSFVRYISTISYSLYLTNLTLFNVVYDFYTPLIVKEYINSGILLYFYYIFFTFLISSILYYLVEKPFLRLRDHFF